MPEKIGVDLDGTLAYYDGWKGAEHIGEPIKEMVGRVQEWLASGKEVYIFTARVHSKNPEAHVARKHIVAWCLKHIGVELEVSAEKDMTVNQFYDDRCVQVERNKGTLVVENMNLSLARALDIASDLEKQVFELLDKLLNTELENRELAQRNMDSMARISELVQERLGGGERVETRMDDTRSSL